jgi:hypothetical protein
MSTPQGLGNEITLDPNTTYAIKLRIIGSSSAGGLNGAIERNYLVHTTAVTAVIDNTHPIEDSGSFAAVWSIVASTPGGLTLRFTLTGDALHTVTAAGDLTWRELEFNP